MLHVSGEHCHLVCKGSWHDGNNYLTRKINSKRNLPHEHHKLNNLVSNFGLVFLWNRLFVLRFIFIIMFSPHVTCLLAYFVFKVTTDFDPQPTNTLISNFLFWLLEIVLYQHFRHKRQVLALSCLRCCYLNKGERQALPQALGTWNVLEY